MSRKKLPYKDIKYRIESVDGYKLLSTEYTGALSKLKFMCPEGHIFWMTWNNFQRGQRCAECYRLSLCLDINYIKEQTSILALGYKLISTKYINNNVKMKFICNKDHTFKMRQAHFQQGRRCPECYRLSQCLGIKDLQEQITIIASSYKLLSTKYVNNNTKMEFMCDKGHTFWMRWGDFQFGQRCPECYYESKWRSYTPEELAELHNYRAVIIKLSEQKYKGYYYKINPNRLKRSRYDYHLDHIYSITDGFKNSIPMKVISNPYNLQMLWWSDNISKYGNSWQSKEDLYKGYIRYISEQLK